MKTISVPATILGVLCLAFLGFLVWSAQQLPEQVATHFGIHGNPDGWMQRSTALKFMGGFGIGLPLLMVVLSFAIRFIPANLVNIPHREYWLGPERRESTYAFLSQRLIWLVCLLVCFMAGIQWVTIEANNSTPVRMPSGSFLMILGAFLAGMAVWIVGLLRHFKRPKAGP